MTDKMVRYESENIGERIYTIRGQKVIMDFDLAAIYCVTTKRLNEQVKRNEKRFPSDFIFQLTLREWEDLKAQIMPLKGLPKRSQFATGLQRHRDPRFMPFAFTEHGAVMVANILRSERAVQMSVFVVRAFVRMRGLLGDSRALARRLADLEKELKARLDIHESAIVSILQRVMDLIDPPILPTPPRKPIGFKLKEQSAKYLAIRKQS